MAKSEFRNLKPRMKNLIFKSFFMLLAFFTLFSCSEKSKKGDLTKIMNSGELTVVTRNNAVSYYENRDGEIVGLDYVMINDFAKWLGVKVNFVVVDSTEEVIHYLNYGRADLAAAAFSITESRKEQFLFGPPYHTTSQKLVCRKDVRPKKIETIIKNGYEIIVEDHTSYKEILEKIKKEHSELSWKTTKELTSLQILEQVANEKVDCTVIDNILLGIARRYFTELEDIMSLGKPSKLAWAMPKSSSQLQGKVNQWFNNQLSQSQLKVWKDRFFGHVISFDRFDIEKFFERIKTRLPKYKELFKKAAKKYNFKWTLLAAMSYQESHWDPKAKSFTGVRGMMMLTLNTAKSLGVTNRLDPEQSIMGGAKYLRRLEEKIPSYIPMPDRLWMAMASYNVGLYHLRDARMAAVLKNKNPNRWAGLREALPFLTHPKVYKRLPHGYARGMEPVIYIDRIRSYHDLLLRTLESNQAGVEMGFIWR